jgi:organic hydroperoxide reductase OsmC/OhrA
MTDDTTTVTMELREGYEFAVDFGDASHTTLLVDEPAPLGGGHGPNAARLLAAAVGNCLSASALLCLRKARIEVHGMRTVVRTSMQRNEHGRLRIGSIAVELSPVVAPDDAARIGRCLDLFEDFCIVTQSVRGGIDVDVQVTPLAGASPAPNHALVHAANG